MSQGKMMTADHNGILLRVKSSAIDIQFISVGLVMAQRIRKNRDSPIKFKIISKEKKDFFENKNRMINIRFKNKQLDENPKYTKMLNHFGYARI